MQSQPRSAQPGPPAAHRQLAQRLSTHDVERKLAKLAREHENLRATYERMLERGPERFQVKPSGVPEMAALYDQLPNFADALDDLKRHVALAQDSGDGIEITPMLLLGPPGIGKTHFRAAARRVAGHRHEPGARELHDRGLAAVRASSSGRAPSPARCSRRWSTASTPTR